jgi:hypothetical protein
LHHQILDILLDGIRRHQSYQEEDERGHHPDGENDFTELLKDEE